MKKYVLSVGFLAFLSVAAGSAVAESPHATTMADKGDRGSAFTLRQVMQDLAHNVSRIQQGILTNNRLMVKNGAAAIADHPKPKGGIKPYVKKNAGDVKDVIPVMDKRVHRTSVEIADQAAGASMEELQERLNVMVTGCVGCHDMFRD